MNNNIILGIDPGTYTLGYGLINIVNYKIQYIKCDNINLKSYKNDFKKLKVIYSNILEIINKYNPKIIIIESSFYHKNVKVFGKLNMVVGSIIAATTNFDIEIFQYTPKIIKQTVTGNGNATKEYVKYILQKILHINIIHDKFDAYDGLAAAVCYSFKYGCNINY